MSRFQSGLIADIQPHDLETRVAIIRNDAKHNGLDLDYSITEFIANTIKKDVRVMKSVLIRLQTLSALKNVDISMDLCRQSLKLNKHFSADIFLIVLKNSVWNSQDQACV